MTSDRPIIRVCAALLLGAFQLACGRTSPLDQTGSDATTGGRGGASSGSDSGAGTTSATDPQRSYQPGDRDCDGVPDAQDNCPEVANAEQLDVDGNARGDACHFRSLAAGSLHTCAVREDGTLWCWGENLQYRSAGPDPVIYNRPIQVSEERDWLQVSVGYAYGCALKQNGSLWCWGNDPLEAYEVSERPTAQPEQEGVSRQWQMVQAGDWHACALDTANELWCWGSGSDGALGRGDGPLGREFARVAGGRRWDRFDAVDSVTCGRSDGSLYCWGANGDGQVGNGSNPTGPLANEPAPAAVTPADGWDAFAASGLTTCGIRDGQLWCWGDNSAGQFAGGVAPSEVANSSVPIYTETADLEPWLSVDAHHQQVCAVNAQGIYCWGGDPGDVLGSEGEHWQPSPTLVLPTTGEVELAVGFVHACALVDGKVWCWGSNSFGQLGVGLPLALELTPARVGSLSNWQEVAVGEGRVCGLESGRLFCWGEGHERGSSPSDSEYVTQPEQIGSAEDWSAVATARVHSCALRQGELHCWGAGSSGLHGPDAAEVETEPRRVGERSNWSTIALGAFNTCGVHGGERECWGSQPWYDDAEELAEVPSAGWSRLSSSSFHSCGINSGQVWCWGDTLWARSLVDQDFGSVHSDDDWTEIATATQHNCGIKSGELWCWGDGFGRRFGPASDGSFQVEPRLVDADGEWQALGVGECHFCGVRDGELLCGGCNGGQLGDGTRDDRAGLQRVGERDDWTRVSVGTVNCGIASGELYCWGQHGTVSWYAGAALGRGDSRSAPVQVAFPRE